MPAAIPAVIAAASAAAAGSTIFGLSVALSATLIGIGSFALNTLGASLAPKPKKQDFSDVATSRTQQVKQPVTERRVIYGECRVAGVINYFGSTQDNKYIHFIYTLASHECHYMGTTWFNDDPIHPDDLDANGNVISGKYANKARIKKHLGGPGQVVDPDLLAEFAEITSDFVGNGIAYLYVRLEKDDALYKSGAPNVQQFVQGALAYDPRTTTTYWSPNPVLALRDYMTHTRYGVSVPQAKFPDANIIASANSCDEIVTTKELTHTSTGVSASADTITLNADLLKFQTGDRVHATTEGTLPGGIVADTDYYVIVHQPVGVVKIKLAASYQDAITRTPIDITDAGTGLLTIIKDGEPRYTTNGTIGMSKTPRDNISDLLSAMAGDMMPVGGKWVMKPGIWVEPTVELTADDLLGSIEVQTKHSRRERFNGVQGLYVTPLNQGEPGDYPLVTNQTYLNEDNVTVPIIAQLDLPMTSRSQTAQRVGNVQLNRHRRQRTLQITTNLRGMQLQSGDTFMLTLPAPYNYNQKKFEVSDFSLVPRQMGKATVLTCDIICAETDSAIYDFDESGEIQPQPAQTSSDPDPDVLTPPGAPNVVEEKYVTTEGSGVKTKAIITFSASTDFFVRDYQVEYKLHTDSAYTVLGTSASTTQVIPDIAPGFYDIRIKASSIFNAHSEYTTGTFTIIGLTDLPGNVLNFSVISLADNATVAWEQSLDIDVKVSGWVRIRHTPDLVNYTWSDARDITDALPGIATSASVPILPGVYMAKFVDSVGNESPTAALIIVASTSAIQMNALATATEHPTFAGTKTSMYVDGGVLRLDGNTLFDSLSGNFDSAVGDFDTGGGTGFELVGSYRFANKIDCGKVIRAYCSTHLLASVYNAIDLFDSREGDFDAAAGVFDGEDITGLNFKFLVRTTNDNPNAVSPTWSAWQQFVAGYFTCRGYEYELQVTSNDQSLQCDITELRAKVDVPDVTDSAKTTTNSGALKTIAYAKTFAAAPEVVAVINDATAGDLVTIPVADVTSSNFKVGVLNSAAYVVRNITWFARGY